MGLYVNPGVGKFEMSLESEIYVDKSDLIAKTNALFKTRQRFVCVSRPRRFGKTMAAEMLAAYYGAGENADALFKNLKISKDVSYRKHLNQYDCLMINMQDFLSQSDTVEEMLDSLQSAITEELFEIHPEVKFKKVNNFVQVMNDVYTATKRHFVILIDEWDCLFREYKDDENAQKDYLDFLRLWLKDKEYVGLAYMTGILPIKKYGTHSALNMFWEYSMTNPGQFLNFFGFTDVEVESLGSRYDLNLEELKSWYNGYFVEAGRPIYNPTSVTQCFMRGVIDNYWNQTETYEALKAYIKLDFDGLRDKIIRMIAGESISINTGSFTNDMSSFDVADDVLTLLIHLGYLSYDFKDKKVRIPNQEIKCEFVNAIQVLGWSGVVDAINASEKLLHFIWNMKEEAVADNIQDIHEKSVSVLQYNDENSLSSVISLALYVANQYYTVVREFPTGKGFADLAYIPRRKFSDKPAMIVELKWDKTAEGAISQIKKKNYVAALDEYKGNLLLVGINYDKKTKKYECLIETCEV